MKKTVTFFCFFLLLIGFSWRAMAQIPTTEGREFYLTFLYNHTNTNPTLSLIISAKNGASGTITNPLTSWSTNFNVGVHGHVEIPIPISAAYSGPSENYFNTGLYVQSDSDISVYASNFYSATFDATGVLPLDALGDEYMLQMWNGSYDGSNFAIVATTDNTIVDITPTYSTSGGHPAGTTYSVNLSRGQVYNVNTSGSSGGDFCGTTVVARDCKKIAVFSGNRCTNTDCSACDHIVEQMWPVWCWGKEFIVTCSKPHQYDHARVTASVNNTRVYLNGTFVTTLQAGRNYDFNVYPTTPVYVSTDQPSCVNVYFTYCTNNYGDGGDPAMVWISPVEQRIQEVTFGTINGSNLNQYVNIIVPSTGVSSVNLDGNNISGEFSTVAANPAYSYVLKQITHGTHTLACDSGFIAYVYGLGSYESYAYSAGSSAANLKAQMFVNDVSSVDISAFQEYCFGDTIDFRAFVMTDYDGISWEFGDGSTGTGDTCPHLYPTYGIYQVNMIVDHHTSSNNCGGYDTITSIVRILQNDTTITEYVCYGFDYDTNGFHIPFCTHDTTINVVFPTVWGCDSFVHLDLHVFPIDPITIPVTICQGDFYLQNDFQIIGQEVGYHTYTHNGTSVGGCDSTTILQVTVKPLPEPYLADLKIACTPNDFPILLNPGDFAGYQWNTGETSQILSASEPGYYEVTVTSADGCTATSATTIELHDVSAKITQGVEFCEDLVTTLYVETIAPNVEWNTGETTPEITVHQHGRYSVTASNEYCETMTAITIEECPFNLFVPNTITPWLEDGKNDFFYLSGDLDYIQEMEINIYDRWGKLAYRSTDKNFRWDGKVDGRWIPNNTFTYKLQIVTILSKRYVYKGHINVL